ncbi:MULTISPECIES: DUF5302 domain-containing protein [Tsukamurella]|uniref:DUF5302 domain-containing protein n=1 Tax=Tsukamurella strandjordii TaxID=147577 RepID=A0AA90NP66_9ACTN|nr:MULTISPECIES: DUF5302 domain-containing protein [Tsukamurella]MDP0398134.1 DUF5302 domain-containing protein [Tsukamurella strandjordii]GIZ98037.1 hypothetical protein TTY48_26490 [Tsukamurella sp. TY48]
MTTDGIADKFKEALERKNASNRKGSAHLDGAVKPQTPHGSESHQQQFRRKSG